MPRESRAEETLMERTERAPLTDGGMGRRVPLGGPKLKMGAQIRKGYVGRWFNDDGSRIQQAQQAGYAFVEDPHAAPNADDVGSRVSMFVGGMNNRGEPRRAFLMEQREDFYKEDQAAKQAAQDELMNSIRRGKPEGEGKARENMQYVPNRGIKVD